MPAVGRLWPSDNDDDDDGDGDDHDDHDIEGNDDENIVNGGNDDKKKIVPLWFSSTSYQLTNSHNVQIWWS